MKITLEEFKKWTEEAEKEYKKYIRGQVVGQVEAYRIKIWFIDRYLTDKVNNLLSQQGNDITKMLEDILEKHRFKQNGITLEERILKAIKKINQ